MVLQGIEAGRERGEAGERHRFCELAGKLVLRSESLSSIAFSGVLWRDPYSVKPVSPDEDENAAHPLASVSLRVGSTFFSTSASSSLSS